MLTGGTSPEKTFSNLSTMFIFQCIQFSDKSTDRKMVKLQVNTTKKILHNNLDNFLHEVVCSEQIRRLWIGRSIQFLVFWKVPQKASKSLLSWKCNPRDLHWIYRQPTNQCQNNKEPTSVEVPISVTLSTPPLLAQVMDQVLEDQTPGQISALRGKNNTMTTL